VFSGQTRSRPEKKGRKERSTAFIRRLPLGQPGDQGGKRGCGAQEFFYRGRGGRKERVLSVPDSEGEGRKVPSSGGPFYYFRMRRGGKEGPAQKREGRGAALPQDSFLLSAKEGTTRRSARSKGRGEGKLVAGRSFILLGGERRSQGQRPRLFRQRRGRKGKEKNAGGTTHLYFILQGKEGGKKVDSPAFRCEKKNSNDTFLVGSEKKKQRRISKKR